MVEGTATLGRPLLMNCSLAIWVIKVGVEDLLGQGQGPPQSLLYNLQVGDQ